MYIHTYIFIIRHSMFRVPFCPWPLSFSCCVCVRTYHLERGGTDAVRALETFSNRGNKRVSVHQTPKARQGKAKSLNASQFNSIQFNSIQFNSIHYGRQSPNGPKREWNAAVLHARTLASFVRPTLHQFRSVYTFCAWGQYSSLPRAGSRQEESR